MFALSSISSGLITRIWRCFGRDLGGEDQTTVPTCTCIRKLTISFILIREAISSIAPSRATGILSVSFYSSMGVRVIQYFSIMTLRTCLQKRRATVRLPRIFTRCRLGDLIQQSSKYRQFSISKCTRPFAEITSRRMGRVDKFKYSSASTSCKISVRRESQAAFSRFLKLGHSVKLSHFSRLQ